MSVNSPIPSSLGLPTRHWPYGLSVLYRELCLGRALFGAGTPRCTDSAPSPSYPPDFICVCTCVRIISLMCSDTYVYMVCTCFRVE